MKIVYHGGGFIGFTGAAYFAKAGHDVIIYDPNREVVEKITKKELPVYGLDDFLKFNPFTRAGEIKATYQFSQIKEYPIHIVAVPTEQQGDPDLSIANMVVERLFYEHPGREVRTVLVESTVSPGFSDGILSERMLDQINGGKIHFAICPRRDWFVDPNDDVEITPRVVGGFAPCCSQAAENILSTISRTIHGTGYREAEAVKAFENAIFYHSITFGFAFAQHYQKQFDVREVLRLQGTHWRLYPLYPSAGIAGYCVPMGLRYLHMEEIKERDFSIEEQWREFVAEEIEEFMHLERAKTLILYGVSEKEKTRVPHFSPAFSLYRYFVGDDKRSAHDFTIHVADSDYTSVELNGMGFTKSLEFLPTLKNIPGIIGFVALKGDMVLRKFLEYNPDLARRLCVFDCVGDLEVMQHHFDQYRLVGRKK